MKVSVVVTFSNLNRYRLRHQSEKYHCIRISYIFNLCYRGFVLLYQKDAKFEGFKLQVQAKSSDYLVEFRCLPTSWSHIAFTWENNGGTQLKKCNKAGFLWGRSSPIYGLNTRIYQRYASVYMTSTNIMTAFSG